MDFYRTEQKINLNLSSFAREVIVEDMFTFLGKENFSGFINIIIENYVESSNASISNRVEAYKSELLAKYSSQDEISLNVVSVVDSICKSYESELVQKMNSFEKGTVHKVRLNNDNYDYLYDLNAGGKDLKYYRDSLGRFVKALIEDYATLSFTERERIFYLNNIQAIESAIANQKLIRVSTVSYYGVQNSLYVKPYGIMRGNGVNYLYLVGMKSQTSDANSPIAIRISRINRIKIESRSGKITHNEETLLRNEINSKSVQYLVGETRQIVVNLTAEGWKRYNNVFHLRPIYIDKKDVSEDCICLIFDTTELQIWHYFAAFGKDAVIVEPTSLRDKFKALYEEASERYS